MAGMFTVREMLVQLPYIQHSNKQLKELAKLL